MLPQGWGDREEGRWGRPPQNHCSGLSCSRKGVWPPRGLRGRGTVAEPGTLLWSCIMCKTNPAHETRASSRGVSETEFCCPTRDFLQQGGTFSVCDQGRVGTGDGDGRRKGRAEQWEPGEGMRRQCGLFLGAVARNVVFSFCSLSCSKTLCLPFALLPGSWTCQQAGLHPPAPSLKGHSPLHPHPYSPRKTLLPYQIGQRKRGWGQTFQSVLVLQNCLP